MALMNNYGTRTAMIVRGEGPYVWDNTGRRYLDALSGIAVCGLGHAHPAVTRAICEQASTLLHISNYFLIEPQVELAERLVAIAGMDKVFFSNSGAEANEAALKIARKWGNDRGIESPTVITTHNSFHGRTMATLSATGNPKVKVGFEPLVEGFRHVPYDDLAAILQTSDAETVAVMVEPVQGEGGIRLPSPTYLKELRQLCDARGWLLILDEIQTGNGRTGEFFCYQHYGILPDVVTTAKGLGNGVPIGACLARGKAAEVFQPGNHGSTFGGNPLACKAALAVIDTLEQENLLERSRDLGARMLDQFRQAFTANEMVKDVRGLGLLLGVELATECTGLMAKAREKGLLINVTSGNTIRLLPPLIITDDQANEIVECVVELVEDFKKAAP